MKKGLLLSTIIVVITGGIILSTYLINEYKNVNDDLSKDKDNEVISTYDSPKIPKGFKCVETDIASWTLDENRKPKGWNNGLVIEDEIGNQFVWVPVKTTNVDKELFWYNIKQNEELAEVENQIGKFGGFYMARYEAGISDDMQENIKIFSAKTNDIEGIPVSRKNRIPWNYITLKNALKNAQAMYENNEYVKSDLISARQWIYVLQWLKDTGIDIENSGKFANYTDTQFIFSGYYSKYDEESESNEAEYEYIDNGNKDMKAMLISTGSTEYTNTNNIYDLAGNVVEYTNTYSEDWGYCSVGGYYTQISGYQSFMDASPIGDKSPLKKFGYRVVLFLK